MPTWPHSKHGFPIGWHVSRDVEKLFRHWSEFGCGLENAKREGLDMCECVCVYMIAGVFLCKWLYHFCYERSRRKQLSEKREGVEGE